MLTELSTTTFTDSFSAQNTEADLFLYLSSHLNRERLYSELADEQNKFFLAVLDEQPIGYLKLSESKPGRQSLTMLSIEIERLYVRKEFHDKKIGAALMQYAIDFALANSFLLIWLGVWEKNQKAILFYKKWGFEIFGDHIFMLGNDAQTDLLMRKEL